MGSRHRDKSGSRSSRHRDRDRDKDRDNKDKDRDRERDKDKDRHRSRRDRSRSKSHHRDRKDRRSKERDRDRDRNRKSKDRRDRSNSRSNSRSRSHSHGRKSNDRYHQDGHLALLDQMVGTTTTTTARNISSSSSSGTTLAGRMAQAALLAATAAANIPQGQQYNLQMSIDPSTDKEETADERRARKRKSRWAGSEHDKTFIPGMPTILPPTLTKEQEEQYLLQLQIEEVSRKLRSGDLGIPANVEERSPSPEPIYSSDGRRLNMREYRTRRKLEEKRHTLVQQMLMLNPEYKPPTDYKPPIIRVNDKVMIPQEQHPDINFVGLLIGPRGNTLKSMEKETGAKIIIRGKGSVKEGKVGRKDGQPLPGEDEPLHAYITATNPECVKKAVEKIKEVIRQGVEVPEGQNDLRRMQLRELAQLNGTLREGENRGRCSNCDATDHKSWMCPDQPNITNNIICTSCGGAGHIAGDCRLKRPGQGGPPPPTARAKIDEEYMSLMAELGEGPPPDKQNQNNQQQRKPNFYGNNLFDPNRPPPRQIMAPPPQMIPNSLPPPPGFSAPPPFVPPPPPPGVPSMPWQQPPPPGSGPANSIPPPPNVNSQVPPLMNNFSSQNNGNYNPQNAMMGMIQRSMGGMMPPGPPGSNATGMGNNMGMQNNSGMVPPVQMAPPGVPPPPQMGVPNQQNMQSQNQAGKGQQQYNMAPPPMNMPPPGWRPPFPPPHWVTPTPNLLAAPPPPPPPS